MWMLSVISIGLIVGIVGFVLYFFLQPDKRRQQLVDAKLQLQIAIAELLLAFLLPVMTVIMIYVPPFASLLSNAPGFTPEDRLHAHQQVLTQLVEYNWTKWPLLLLILVFIGLLSIIFSHQLIGPIHRIKSIVRRLRENDFTAELRFRSGDFQTLTSIEEDLNQSIAQVAMTLASVRKEAEEIRAHRSDSVKVEEAAGRILGLVGRYKT